jgi:Tat protein translocase TatB subunit
VFDIGLQELIIIFLVALLVFGPKKLPELAKTLGKGLGDLKRAFQDVKDHVETEFDETNKTIDTALKDEGQSSSDEKEDTSTQASDKNHGEH